MKVSIVFIVTTMGLASEFINGPMVVPFAFLVMVRRQYSDLLRSEQFGVRIQVGAKFSASSRMASGPTHPPVQWLPDYS
jgi:hypothetical protein